MAMDAMTQPATTTAAQRFTFPYPPGVNNLYATFRNRRIPSREAKAFKAAAVAVLIGSRAVRLAGPVAVRIDVYRPRRAGDLDGRLKAAIDAMTGYVYEDDEQVVEIEARRFEDKANPRVEVTVTPAATAATNGGKAVTR